VTAHTTVPIHEVILDADQVAALPEEAVKPGHHDVRQSLLWRSGAAYAGLMTLDPGARLPAHSHHVMAHHVWVVRGEAHVLHQRLGAGSYWYIPPGIDHGLSAGTDGCSLFYLYAPPAETPMEARVDGR
jgi:quercetin dioxygenase-like cupin family protein